MLTLSNALSFSRAFLALAFLQSNPLFRLLAIILAMISDFLDGFIARRRGTTTQFGAILDPIMDKFFVFFAGTVFLLAGRISAWQLAALVSRDIFLCLFALYLSLIKGWKGYRFHALWWGKIITVGQFLALFCLTLNATLPSILYGLFIVMATFAFIELFVGYVRKTDY